VRSAPDAGATPDCQLPSVPRVGPRPGSVHLFSYCASLPRFRTLRFSRPDRDQLPGHRPAPASRPFGPAHVASAEGIICVEKISGLNPSVLDYDNIPSCTYCNPEVSSVGFTEKEAIDLGYEINVGKFPFSASGKANASGHPDGFVKVIFDKKYGEWLGCHMIGYNVTEMIAEAVVARKLETTGYEILKAIHPHPTMSEAVMEAVADAYDEVIHI